MISVIKWQTSTHFVSLRTLGLNHPIYVIKYCAHKLDRNENKQ